MTAFFPPKFITTYIIEKTVICQPFFILRLSRSPGAAYSRSEADERPAPRSLSSSRSEGVRRLRAHPAPLLTASLCFFVVTLRKALAVRSLSLRLKQDPVPLRGPWALAFAPLQASSQRLAPRFFVPLHHLGGQTQRVLPLLQLQGEGGFVAGGKQHPPGVLPRQP